MARASRSAASATHDPVPTRELKVQSWPLDRFIRYARNARTHSDEQIAQIAASIREFGFVNPILVGPDQVIVAGHARLMAARKLGLAEVPVIIVDGLNENQRRALALADNRLPQNAGWDEEMLRLEIEALRNAEYDLGILGFEDDELRLLLARQEATGGLTDEDAAPEVLTQPVSTAGDLWLLGDHRLICGDCTDRVLVERVLGDSDPLLLVTDPPYGIELDSEWRDRAGLNGCGPAEPSFMKKRTEGHTQTTISGDTRADWSEAFELVPTLQVAYVWHASVFTRDVLNGLERIGFLYPQQIIWNKGRVVLTRTHYWYQHEPCWYVRKKRAAWYGKPGSENSTIWDSPSPKFIMGSSDEEKFDHPTQKPVELMRKPIRNHTVPTEGVYDPFCGSGTTLIAAEQTGRICYAVELDPKYVDVIVRRWQSFTGKYATLEVDGRTFDEITEERGSVGMNRPLPLRDHGPQTVDLRKTPEDVCG